MKKVLLLVGVLVLGLLNAGAAEGLPHRWVQVSFDHPDARGEIDRFRGIADLAVEHGYTGILLMGSFDSLDIEPIYVHKALREVRQICEERGLDVIPTVMNVGYNSFILKHNRNLAEGLPVRDALFVAGAEEAQIVPEIEPVKRGFEEGLPEDAKLDPEVAAIDRQVWHSGAASLGFSNYGERPAIYEQGIEVRPNRLYRVSFWVRSDDTGELSPFGPGRFGVNIYGERDGRQLSYFDPQTPAKTDWRRVTASFNSLDYEKVNLRIGVRQGGTGAFWLDDLIVEEIGLVNVLRRPGTPLVVRAEDGERIFQEGVDFAHVEDPLSNFLFDHEGPGIRLLPGSAIREGDRLRVSFYHPVVIYQGQTPVCMSEPEVHAIWRRLAQVVTDTLQPDMYLLNMDEVRVAASCEACKQRGIPVTQMLGETLRMQMDMIRKVNPDAQFLTWSDMFDPFHNAGDRGGDQWYYLVNENFHRAWEHLPEGITLIDWNQGHKDESVEFFEELGHEVIVAGYYDDESRDSDKEWVKTAREHENVTGIIYSTWLDGYEAVGDFIKLFEE